MYPNLNRLIAHLPLPGRPALPQQAAQSLGLGALSIGTLSIGALGISALGVLA